MNTPQNLIPYDRMKEQIEKEILSLAAITGQLEMPRISYEKGTTLITFPVPKLTEALIFRCAALMKDHLENVRVHGLGDGYYAFQALNRNLFKTENMLDNFKLELFGLSSSFRADISRKGDLTQDEITLVVGIYRVFFQGAADDPVAALRKYGASVFLENNELDWNYIAGYEDVKRRIRESVVLPLQNPGLYDEIARFTRRTFESNRPRAILFEGPPGVGKTTVARILAGEVKVPLVYVPVESIMSKWYGQSSQNLAGIFESCDALGAAILFLDEIDSLAGSRNQNMFEATRRVLSVLLRKLDGIDAVSNTITIGATNRREDLDHALVSRFDQTIFFPLPGQKERAAIFSGYARHLDAESCDALAERSDGLSGRNIKDVCEFTERRWARKLIVEKQSVSAPDAAYYLRSVQLWKNERENPEDVAQ